MGLGVAWEAADPIIIMAISAIILGILGLLVLSIIPKGVFKELFKVLVIVIILGGSFISLRIVATIWVS